MTKTWWTESEMDRLAALMDKGEKSTYIAEVMHKPLNAVRHQMRWRTLSKTEKSERSRIARAKRLIRDVEKSAQDYRSYSRKPSPEALAQRDYIYYEAPRTITAIMLGDPPAGRSALDKRVSA